MESVHRPRIGDPLPNVQRAYVPKAKLYDYALHPTHSDGGPKARLWLGVFGIGRHDWHYARDQILEGLGRAAVSDVRRGYVTTYEVIVVIRGRNGRVGPVTTGWKFVNGAPHLVTALPRV